MKVWTYTMIIAALLIYIGSAVFIQYGNLWNDWICIVAPVWVFSLFLGGFHIYRNSKLTIWPMDLAFLALIGFTAINAIHSIYCFIVWVFTNKSMNAVLVAEYDHYNPFYCLFAILVSMVAGFLYLINLPNILHREK